MTEAILRVEGLTKHYGGLQAVRGVSFDVAPGTITGLIGPNGAGKYGKLSSLENLMVAGANQTGENIFMNWIASGRVKQREQQVLEKAHDTLEFLGLTHVTNELAGRLSGGQKKLLELGRTMMSDARLILLDEPGAGVNPTLMLKVADMIRKLNEERGYTFCIIEHDMDLIASLCKETIVLAEGQVLTKGTMEAIRQDERVIDAYFGGDVVE